MSGVERSGMRTADVRAAGVSAGAARDAAWFSVRPVVDGDGRDASTDGTCTVPVPIPATTDLPHSRHFTMPGRSSESQWGQTSGVETALKVAADTAEEAGAVLVPFVALPGFQPHSRQRNIPARSSFPQSGHSVNSVPVAILRPPWRSARPVATPVEPQAEVPLSRFARAASSRMVRPVAEGDVWKSGGEAPTHEFFTAS